MASPTVEMSATVAAVFAIVAPAMTLVHTVGRLDTRPSLNRVCALGARTTAVFIPPVPGGKMRSRARCPPTSNRCECCRAERPKYMFRLPSGMSEFAGAAPPASRRDRCGTQVRGNGFATPRRLGLLRTQLLRPADQHDATDCRRYGRSIDADRRRHCIA